MFFTPPPAETTQEATSTEVRLNWAETVSKAEGGIETLVVTGIKTEAPGVRAALISAASYGALKLHRQSVAHAFESALKRVAKIKREPDQGCQAMDSAVADLMAEILRELMGVLGVGPDRTVQTRDGGIDSYFFSAEKDEEGSPLRIVSLGVDSDRDASILFRSGEAMAAEDLTPETDLPRLATRITDFLSGEQSEPASQSGAYTLR
jgi:hypothetical protein